MTILAYWGKFKMHWDATFLLLLPLQARIHTGSHVRHHLFVRSNNLYLVFNYLRHWRTNGRVRERYLELTTKSKNTWTCTWSQRLNLLSQSCSSGAFHPRCKSKDFLSFLYLSSFLYSLTFMFPVCVSCFLALNSLPSYFRFLPSLHLSTRPALLSHLILPWNVKNSDFALSTLSRLTNIQLLKLHWNLPRLLHFRNLISKSLSTMSLSPARGDLPQVLGSEEVTAVAKHDCRIDWAEHCNSW